MTVTITWVGATLIATLFTAWTGFLFGVIRWFVNREVANLDARMQASEQNSSEAKTNAIAAGAALTANREEFLQFLAKLPLEYYRREDMIRFETLTHAKLDALGGEIRKLECRKCPQTSRP